MRTSRRFVAIIFSLSCLPAAHAGFMIDGVERRVSANAGNMDGGDSDVLESFDVGVFDETAMVSVSAGFASSPMVSDVEPNGFWFFAAGSASAGAVGMFSGAGANAAYNVAFTLTETRVYDLFGWVQRNAIFPGASPSVALNGPDGNVFVFIDEPGGGSLSFEGRFVLGPGSYELFARADASDSGVGVGTSGSFDFGLILVPSPGTLVIASAVGLGFTIRRRP